MNYGETCIVFLLVINYNILSRNATTCLLITQFEFTLSKTTEFQKNVDCVHNKLVILSNLKEVLPMHGNNKWDIMKSWLSASNFNNPS